MLSGKLVRHSLLEFIENQSKKQTNQIWWLLFPPPTLKVSVCELDDAYLRLVIHVAFKNGMTERSLLMRIKTRKPLTEYKGVIYKILCQDCKQVYIRETGRPVVVRMKEHGEIDKLAVALHRWTHDYQIDWESGNHRQRKQTFPTYM